MTSGSSAGTVSEVFNFDFASIDIHRQGFSRDTNSGDVDRLIYPEQQDSYIRKFSHEVFQSCAGVEIIPLADILEGSSSFPLSVHRQLQTFFEASSDKRKTTSFITEPVATTVSLYMIDWIPRHFLKMQPVILTIFRG
jgi:hypothetical protein